MMRIVACACLAIYLVALPLVVAAPEVETSPTKPSSESARVAATAGALAAVTGIAISPLLGTGVYGAYKYIAAGDEASRSALPWFAWPSFFIPALIISGLCAAKDTFGVAFPPGLKKPLDVMELIENKISGLIAAGAVVPITMGTLGKVLVGPSAMLPQDVLPSGLAMLSLGAMDTSSSVNFLTVPLGMTIFAVVWMASHAINVLILLSPWGAVDAVLKMARTAVLGLIAFTSQTDPIVAGVLSLIVIVAAYCVSGWAFRLTVFGTIFSWDFLTGRRHRISTTAESHQVFSSSALTHRKVPIRSYGHLVRAKDGRRLFRYRPWLILPTCEADVSESKMKIARGVFFSTVLADDRPLFILPPRYHGHEHRIAETYHFVGVEDAGLRKAWRWLSETLDRRATPTLTP